MALVGDSEGPQLAIFSYHGSMALQSEILVISLPDLINEIYPLIEVSLPVASALTLKVSVAILTLLPSVPYMLCLIAAAWYAFERNPLAGETLL